MGEKLHLFSMVPVLVIILLFAFDHGSVCQAEEMNILPFSDLVKVFGSIARPFDVKKKARNNVTDVRTGELLKLIEMSTTGMDKVIGEAEKALKLVPAVRQYSLAPLQDAKDEVVYLKHKVIDKLRMCSRLLNLDMSPSDNFAEKHNHELSSSLDVITRDDIPEVSETHVEMRDLIEPVKPDEAQLDDILDKFGRETHVKLEDAMRALVNVAEMIEGEHLQRFIGLGPKIHKASHNLHGVLDKEYDAQTKIREGTVEAVRIAHEARQIVQQVHEDTDMTTSGIGRMHC